jgi:hypothetical protein
MNWEGEALPSRTYRQIVRSANRQVGKDSDWWMTFLEGSASALLKKFQRLLNRTPHFAIALRTSFRLAGMFALPNLQLTAVWCEGSPKVMSGGMG